MGSAAALRLHLGMGPAGEPDGTTRLLVRERYAYTKRWAPFLSSQSRSSAS